MESELKKLSSNQLDNLVSQLNAMTGNYGYGKLFNSQKDKQNQKWSPSSWTNALAGKSGSTQDRYRALLNQYQSDYPSMNFAEIAKGSSQANANDYEKSVTVNQAASVQSTYEYNDINTHLENIQKLTDSIETAENEKSIADLNARINAEVAYLSVEMIKMLAILNQQYVQTAATTLAGRRQASKMNQIPKEKETI